MRCMEEEILKIIIPFDRKRTKNCENSSSLFLILFCRYASLRSARYICLAANSICFRVAQTRYDINPRSRSEHIECVAHIERTSVYRKSAYADLYRRAPALRQVRHLDSIIPAPHAYKALQGRPRWSRGRCGTGRCPSDTWYLPQGRRRSFGCRRGSLQGSTH